jgi:hypothetical protein
MDTKDEDKAIYSDPFCQNADYTYKDANIQGAINDNSRVKYA